MGLYRDYIGKMENKMEATIEGLGFRVSSGTAVCSPGFRIDIPCIIRHEPATVLASALSR